MKCSQFYETNNLGAGKKALAYGHVAFCKNPNPVYAGIIILEMRQICDKLDLLTADTLPKTK